MLLIDQQAALAALPSLLPADAETRSEAFNAIRQVIAACGEISPEDEKRCLVADQYWAATKTHLTVRQFQALQPLGIAPR